MNLEPTARPDPAVDAQVGDRLIRFDRAADFRMRALFSDNVDPARFRLVRPIGGYSYAEESYVFCGLKNCCRPHGLGLFVLLERLDSGDAGPGQVETNIGHCCGRTKYQLEWDALELQLQRSKRTWAIKDLADKVTKTRDERLSHAKAVRAVVLKAQSDLEPIRNLMSSDRALARAFQNCARTGGAMVHHRSLSEDERALYPGQRTLPLNYGVLQGYAALAETADIALELKDKVIAKLWQWQELDLSKTPKGRLEEISREMADFDEVIRRAEHFTGQVERLMRRENWRGLREFCVASGAGISGKSKTILMELAGEPPRRY